MQLFKKSNGPKFVYIDATTHAQETILNLIFY